jgi:hypothetical protein
MIQIFNGRSRALGQDGQEAVYVQVAVTMRSHLHHFKGARLGVLMAIALHSNAEGWAWPSLNTLRSETGYNVQTISQALKELCTLTIDGQRVLLSVQDRTATGTFTTNRYLLFPSDADLANYAGEDGDPQAQPPLEVLDVAAPEGAVPGTAAPPLAHPPPERPPAVTPPTARPSSTLPSTESAYERSTMGNKNHDREGEGERVSAPARGAPADESPGAADHPAVAAYRTTFGQSPTARQATAIAECVTDLARWQRVLDDWLTNAWRRESVGKMLDRYQHQHAEGRRETQPRPSGRAVSERQGRPSAAPTPDELARFLNRPQSGDRRPSA